jgi:thioredoxin-related protein
METYSHKSVLTFLFIVLQVSIFAQIKFQDLTIEKAIEKAKTEKKQVFFYFSSDQCSFCKIMESQVFTDPALGKLINENYIAVRSADNIKAWRLEQYEYQIKIYPTIIFMDYEKGEVVRLEGKKSLEIVKKASEDVLVRIYDSGDKTDPNNDKDTNLVIRKGALIKNEE